jgi:hypothetical protein
MKTIIDDYESMQNGLDQIRSEMELKYGPICTFFVYPPIPVRDFDWEAWYDNLDESGPVGRGPTKEAAIADLLQQDPF